jgi:hypothetical protein
MTEQPDRDPPHLYVPQGHLPSPANVNEPPLTHIDVERLEPDPPTKPAHRRPAHLKVLSDLPDRLPVLPQEVALIRSYLPALLALIAANDNDPSHV